MICIKNYDDVNSRTTIGKVYEILKDHDSHDEFTTYCEEHDYIRPRLIELILEEFLERYGVKPGDKNGSPG